MSEEKLIDHVVSRLEPQILDYVEVRHPRNTANLLQIVDKYEERLCIDKSEVRHYGTRERRNLISEEVYRNYFSYRPRQKTKDSRDSTGSPVQSFG
ncbi:hypothetical protein TNCV_4698071 [Trichonephila clavipes]|nr:hypothetical protein TNCV_4698071 [Trichonephila clavipes]